MTNLIYGDKKNKTVLITLSVVYGLTFPFFFMFYGFGINLPIYLAAVLGGTYWALSFAPHFGKTAFLSLAAITEAIGCTFVFSRNEFLLGLNILLIPCLYTAAVNISLYGTEAGAGNFFGLIFKPFAKLFQLPKAFGGEKNSKGSIGKILLGTLGGLLALCVIIPLMLDADDAFGAIVKPIFSAANLGLNIFRIITAVLVMCYAYGFIYSALLPSGGKALPPERARESTQDTNGYAYTVLAFLVTVLAAYVIFAGVQITYFFFKISAGLPVGFSHTQYARGGVFQLWALTVINLIITLSAGKLTQRMNAVKKIIFPLIYTVYTTANICMTFTAFFKMKMYMDVYGFTRSRLIVMIYLAVQLGLLLLLMYKVWRPSFRYVLTAFYIISLLYTVMCFVNVDAAVARLNIARYNETGKIDDYYLSCCLSDDAFFTVYDFAVTTGDETLKSTLADGINERITAAADFEKERNWREYNTVTPKIAKAAKINY